MELRKMSQKSYRLKANVNEDTVLKVQMQQDIDFLEILSLKINQEKAYQLHSSNYGIIVGRVVANNAFGIENVKVSVFVSIEDKDLLVSEIKNLYPYEDVSDTDRNGIRYNLLQDQSLEECYQAVGTFPNKRFVLDNDTAIEVFDKYWKYTTVTNASGDYMLYGVPVGVQQVHIEVDLSDCGILSQKPFNFIDQGYNANEFENSSQFKIKTNLDDLPQIIKQDKSVNVYPFWGDTQFLEESEIAISRCDVQLNYEFTPSCFFFGGTITDSKGNINHYCRPSQKSGTSPQLIATEGMIEMIRKTQDGYIEDFKINGNQLIDEDGVFCYQIPMNLDYVTTDEMGNIVPTNNPKQGIPTRTSVRFRFSINEDDASPNHMARLLVPNNPYLQNDKRKKDDKYDYSKCYEFGSKTQDGDFRDLFWNNVYSVKSYIPRIQRKNWLSNNPHFNTNNYSALRSTNLSENTNPIPFNNIRVRMPFTFLMLCLVSKIVLEIVKKINQIVTGLSVLTCFMKIWGHCIGIPTKVIRSWARCISFSLVSDVDDEEEVHYYPGCGEQAKKWLKQDHPNYKIITSDKGIGDKIEQNLAAQFNITNLDFYNDWLNGSLYFPRWHWRKVKKKKILFGLFHKDAESIYCNCDNDKQKMYKGHACSLVNSSIVNDPHKKFASTTIHHGLIKEKTNKDGLNVYYYISANNLNEGETKPSFRLYATDIILLGSINEHNAYGLPQCFKYLPSTTANIPEIVATEEDGEYVESGMDWGNGKEAKEDNPKYRKGMLYDLGCTKINTLTKSCVNVKRLCELGVTTDETFSMQVPTANGVGEKEIDMDGMITHYEINDNESRAMFASLNHNGLTQFATTPFSHYKSYNLMYLYPYDFDGLMEASAKKYNNTTDYQDPSYMIFRYGTPSFAFESKTKIPQTNNSFYFYFGLNHGKTALDKFKERYFAPCSKDDKHTFTMTVSGSPSPVCDGGIPSGTISVTFDDEILTPYSYELSDIYGIDTYSESNLYENEFKIRNLGNDMYTLTVTDAKGKQEKVSVNLEPEYISMNYDYSKLGDKYYGLESVMSLCDNKELFGDINIYSIILDGNEYSITKIDSTTFKGKYKLTLKHEEKTAYAYLSIEVNDTDVARDDISSFEECGCMGINQYKSIDLVGEEDKYVRITIWVPGTYHLTISQITDDECVNTSTFDVTIENGEPFEAYLNEVPVRFMMTDKNHNMLQKGEVSDGGSHFFTSPFTTNYGSNSYYPTGWFWYVTKSNAYNFGQGGSMQFNKDNVKYWENYIKVAYEKSGKFTDFTLYTAVAYELQSIFNIAKGALVSSDYNNYGFHLRTIGGKEPIAYRLIKIDDSAIENTTSIHSIEKYMRGTSANSVYPIPYACNIVNRNYSYFVDPSTTSNDDGYYRRWGFALANQVGQITTQDGVVVTYTMHINKEDSVTTSYYDYYNHVVGWGYNPLYTTDDNAQFIQGNFMAAFTKNAGYSVTSCKNLRGKPYQSIPQQANKGSRQICLNGAYNYLLSEWRDSTLENYIRTEFVDERIDYNLLIITSSVKNGTDKIEGANATGSTIIYGDIINGVTCSYHIPILTDGGEVDKVKPTNFIDIAYQNAVNEDDYVIPKYTVIDPHKDNSNTTYEYYYSISASESMLRDAKDKNKCPEFYDAFIQCDTDKYDLVSDKNGNRRYCIQTPNTVNKNAESKMDLINGTVDGGVAYKVKSFKFKKDNDNSLYLQYETRDGNMLSNTFPQARFINLAGLPSCDQMQISLTNCSYDTKPFVKKTYKAMINTSTSEISYDADPLLTIQGEVTSGDTEELNLRINGLYELVDGTSLYLRNNETENEAVGNHYQRWFSGGALSHMNVAVKVKSDDTNNEHRQSTIGIYAMPYDAYVSALNQYYTDGKIASLTNTFQKKSLKFNFENISEVTDTYTLTSYSDTFWKKEISEMCWATKNKVYISIYDHSKNTVVTKKTFNLEDITSVIGLSEDFDSFLGKTDRDYKPKTYEDYLSYIKGNDREILVKNKVIGLPSKQFEFTVNYDIKNEEKKTKLSKDIYPNEYEGVISGLLDGSTLNDDKKFEFPSVFRFWKSSESNYQGYYAGPVRMDSRNLVFNDEDEIINALDNGEYYWWAEFACRSITESSNNSSSKSTPLDSEEEGGEDESAGGFQPNQNGDDKIQGGGGENTGQDNSGTNTKTTTSDKWAVFAETLYVNASKNRLAREAKVVNLIDVIDMSSRNKEGKTLFDISYASPTITISFNIELTEELYGENWYNDSGVVIDIQIPINGSVINLWYQTNGIGEEVMPYNYGRAKTTYSSTNYNETNNKRTWLLSEDKQYVILTISEGDKTSGTIPLGSLTLDNVKYKTNTDVLNSMVVWLYPTNGSEDLYSK